MLDIVPLDGLNESELGTVVDFDGPESWRHRLQELGLREGVTVRLVKRGSPCVVAINGQRLCLRSEPGTMILVEVASTPVALSH